MRCCACARRTAARSHLPGLALALLAPPAPAAPAAAPPDTATPAPDLAGTAWIVTGREDLASGETSSWAQNFFETITLMDSPSIDIAPPSKAQWWSLQSARPLSGVSGPPLENHLTCAASRPNGTLSSSEWNPQNAQRWRKFSST